jgi:hypothetical protein
MSSKEKPPKAVMYRIPADPEILVQALLEIYTPEALLMTHDLICEVLSPAPGDRSELH